jgi:biopolymer transport protein ExbB/TolQ
MNITLKRIGTMMLLASASVSTTAAFAQSRLYETSFMHVSQNDDRNRSNQDRRGNDDRRQSADRANDNNANRNAEQSRRDPKLSPDERRALRRQIDEAGRDIYAPRR